MSETVDLAWLVPGALHAVAGEADDKGIRIETEVSMRATCDAFILHANLRAYENGALACEREFSDTIPRDLL